MSEPLVSILCMILMHSNRTEDITLETDVAHNNANILQAPLDHGLVYHMEILLDYILALDNTNEQRRNGQGSSHEYGN